MLKKIKRWFRNRRKNKIVPRYLHRGWVDKDVILEHIVFEILSKFIEEECNPEIVQWYGEYGAKVEFNGEERYFRDVIQEIYDWYHGFYQNESDNYISEPLNSVNHPKMVLTPIENRPGMKSLTFEYEKPEDKLTYNLARKQSNEREQEVEDKITNYMNFIVKYRKWMWT